MALSKGQLHSAKQWAKAHPNDQNTLDRAFLAASEKLHNQLERERRANRRLRLLVLLALLIGLVAVLLAGIAWQSSVEARLQRDVAKAALKTAEAAKGQAVAAAAAEGLARQTAEAGRQIAQVNEASLLASRADFELTQAHAPQQALLLAVEASRVQLREGEPAAPAARQSLYSALSAIGGIGLGITASPPTALAISADSHWIAVGTQDGTIWLWTLASGGTTKPPIELRGHSGAVRSVAFSSDSQKLAAGGQDAQILLWDLSKGGPVADRGPLSGPSQPITMVRFSPDGRWLVSAGFMAQAWRWDLRGNASPATLSGHTALIRDLAISPDGHWLLTASEDGTLRRWDMRAADPAASAAVLSGHEGIVTGLVITPDSLQAISGSIDGTVRVWDLAAEQPTELLRLPVGFAVEGLAMSADGRWLVAADHGVQTEHWDLRASDVAASRAPLEGRVGKPIFSVHQGDEDVLFAAGSDFSLRSWQLGSAGVSAGTVLLGHESQPLGLEGSADGRWMVSAGVSGDIRLWDAATFSPAIPLDLAPDGAATQATSIDGRLALVSTGLTIALHDLRTSDPRRPAMVLPAAVDQVMRLVASADRWLAWSGNDGRVELADLTAPSHSSAIRELRGPGAGLTDLTLSTNGRWLAGVNSEGLILWSIGSDGETTELDIDLPLVGGNSLAFRPDGQLLAVGTIDGEIMAVNLDGTGRLAPPLDPTPREAFDAVERLAFSPDSQLLAALFRPSGASGAVLRLWRTAQPQVALIEYALEGDTQLNALSFSPDGRWLAAGGSDHLIQLWDLQDTGEAPRRTSLGGHEGTVNDLAFSPDSQRLASAGEDGTLRIWSIRDPAEQSRPLVLQRSSPPLLAPAPLTQVIVSDDGRWLVGLRYDGKAELWSMQQADLLAQACRTAGRNLSQEEWSQFFPGQPYHPICTL